jgi:hypothetical protein
MTKLLRELLSEKEPDFSAGIVRLEKAVGSQAVDVRLSGEIYSLAHAKMKALRLDPKDTTGAELYAALRAEVTTTESHLMAFLGTPANGEELAVRTVQWVSSILAPKKVWGVRDASIKKLLKQNPPKAVMKALHFSSVDSMAKRLPVSHALMAARIVESKTWWVKTHKIMADFSHKDFQSRDLEICALTDEKWLPLASKWIESHGTPVVSLKELGAVGVFYSSGNAPATVMLSLCLHAASEVITHGAYLKLHYVHSSQGSVLVDACNDGQLISGSVVSRVVHWRDIQRFFGLHVYGASTSFAHLETSDLEWLRSEVVLASYVPEVSFWAATDFVGVSYGPQRIVSMNIHDAALNTHFSRPYTMATKKYLERSLRSELMARYIKEPTVRALALARFDISGIIQEDW